MQFQIQPNIWNMSKIKILIYTLDIYNLQTRTALFPDQENSLKSR